MQVFVINLNEDAERRSAITRQLDGLALPHELVTATKGTALSPEEIRARYDKVRFGRNEGRPAMPGELGCALSHIAVYRLVVERNIPFALILEDDAWLSPNVPQILRAIERDSRADQKRIFLLTWFSSISTVRSRALWSSYRLAKVRSALCAHGYVVTYAAAEALVKALYPVRHLADCWNWLRRHRVVDVLAVVPPCITADLSYGTQTTSELGEVLARQSRTGRFWRKSRRAYWRMVDLAAALVRRIGAGS